MVIVVVLDDFSTLSMHRGIDKVENVLLLVLSIGRKVGIHVIIVTSISNEAKTQKTIRLSALTKVGAQKCAFGDIKSEISKYA